MRRLSWNSRGIFIKQSPRQGEKKFYAQQEGRTACKKARAKNVETYRRRVERNEGIFTGKLLPPEILAEDDLRKWRSRGTLRLHQPKKG